jgi:predicted NBD/HSP70 family sugar kinase
MQKEMIVADIGGTHMRFAFLRNHKVRDFIEKNTPKTKEKILRLLSWEIKKLIDKNGKMKIGIACAGVIDKDVIKVSPNLPLKNVNLKKFLQKKFKTKVKVENDANCVALAEAKFGVKRKNFFILTLGTGVGGGIIINGKLYKGEGSGGELGHIILNKEKDFEYHFKRAKPSIEKMADVVGQGIASLISVFDPEIIVITGGFTNFGNPFLSKIKNQAKKYNFLHRMPEIKFSEMENPGLIGAGLLWS